MKGRETTPLMREVEATSKAEKEKKKNSEEKIEIGAALMITQKEEKHPMGDIMAEISIEGEEL